MNTTRSASLLAAFIWAVTTPWMAAQITTTSVAGTVIDATGPGRDAHVTATNASTNFPRAPMTNTQGEYRIDFLPIGSYSVAVRGSL